ncbi:GNAT family N-acetyltransferase [Kerstersia sp.]|uniref:GNAT family N-acetyltransferase n=1 Tax=Kerstersia sp. TaxID=1930783 RepID=UPI003F922074
MTPSAIHIRAYEAADLPCLSAIWFEASRRVHGFLGEARLAAQRQLIEDSYLPKAETWVACQAGQAVGFIGLLDNFIGGLFVDPAAQGGGVGQALMAHALRLKGPLELEVYAANTQALRFYQRLGCAETGRQAEDSEGLPFAVVQLRYAPVLAGAPARAAAQGLTDPTIAPKD